MLKKLQKKFILLTTLISVIVMILIAVAINYINYNSIVSYSDEVLSVLLEHNLNLYENTPPPGRFPMEFAFTTRFFVVSVNSNDEIDFIDTKNISSVSYERAVTYVLNASEAGELSGTVDNFRYIKTENSIGYTYIFLDIEEDLMGFESYMLYSIIIVLSAVVFIFILSCIFSKRAVSPIAESYERQKRFITDVSHEFKTPLTIIKADCDVIELDSGSGEWTDSIKTQISRLDNLVENLISLTRLDEEKLAVSKTIFSLSDAIADILGEFTPAIKNANLNITSNIGQNITYNGNEMLIRELFSILMENAIKYSEGYIEVSLLNVGGRNIFKIENSTDDVAIGKHSNWFERFYRADESRSSDKKGFGIGLSIAKSICEKHGAKISAESKTGKEITLTIAF